MPEKIGIFGGTFNPPHLGHARAAASAVKAIGLDRLVLMPASDPPHKEIVRGSPSGEQRLELLRQALKSFPESAEVSDIEVRREGKSYTALTVRQLMEQNRGAELWLLIGSDMLLSFESWYEFEWLFANVCIGAFSRGQYEDNEIKRAAQDYRERYGARIEIVTNRAIGISSTELRGMLGDRCGRVYLDDELYAYIIKHRLYGAEPDYAWLREKAYAMLEPKRIKHARGVETEAVRLAERWGCDPDEARTAGILHDITKRLKLADQLLLCEKYGIMTSKLERKSDKLLHARTGAAVAKHEFGVSDEVARAIDCHTTGRADMTTLDKVVYVADYIEPSRMLDGIDELRRLAYYDLDAAVLLGLKTTMGELREKRAEPDERSLAAIKKLGRKDN